MTYSSAPALIEKEINALIKANYYSSMSDAIKDAFRALFEMKPNLRIISAQLLYKNNEVSLSKAAEIAGVSIEDFKEMLTSVGIERVIEPDEDINQNVEDILEWRTLVSFWIQTYSLHLQRSGKLDY